MKAYYRPIVAVLVMTLAGLALVGCGGATAEAVPTPAATADPAALVGPMQGLMTGMHNLMQQYQGTPMPPEAITQMQDMMTGMQGLMGQMQGMPGTENMPGMMQQMQGMMGTMQAMPGMGMPGMMGQTPDTGTPMPMQGMMMGDAPVVPAGVAYADGETIRFIHTEASDPDIAQLLSDMMASPVLVVPSLADAPESATAPVYVFTNGPVGMGPLGFQPDVFPFPPGADGYTPLRRVHLVTWADPAAARELKSAAEVKAALAAGELTEEVPGVVVNMPFVTWPGGGR